MQSINIKSALVLALSVSSVLAGPIKKRCTSPSVNSATLSLVESFEGWSATPYSDVGGNPTIGYGHLCSTASCSEIGYSIPLSKADGDKLLQSDLKVAENCITFDTTSNVVLNANQYGALVDWAFNVGCGNAGSSTLIAQLNAGDDPTTVAENQLPQWDESDGEVVAGLQRRRQAEITLFKTATDDGALPACS